MPGKHVNGVAEQTCRRCKESSAALVVRTEPLCRECFIRYVQTKIVKRMETFRVRNAAPNQKRKLLLPLSLGVSSITLLSVIDLHLKNQNLKTGRTGFTVTVLFVDTTNVEQSAPSRELLARVQERYPDHQYVTLSLEDIFDHLSEDDPLDALPNLDSVEGNTSLEKFSKLMQSLTSATARADVIPILRTRLAVAEAKRLGCEGVLWGDSTTRLAEKTLAETAKGRGFSLPWHISDGESPFGITFNYPMRDVFKKELVSYVDFTDPPLSDIVHEPSGPTQANISSKNTTIDDLMKQYFESVEENFPSIVSNVVRTTSKLEPGRASSSDARCSLCQMPVADGRFGLHGWGGDQQDGQTLAEAEPVRPQQLCYGCTRSLPRQTG